MHRHAYKHSFLNVEEQKAYYKVTKKNTWWRSLELQPKQQATWQCVLHQHTAHKAVAASKDSTVHLLATSGHSGHRYSRTTTQDCRQHTQSWLGQYDTQHTWSTDSSSEQMATPATTKDGDEHTMQLSVNLERLWCTWYSRSNNDQNLNPGSTKAFGSANVHPLESPSLALQAELYAHVQSGD